MKQTINVQKRKMALYLVMWVMTGLGMFAGAYMDSFILVSGAFLGIVFTWMMFKMDEDFYELAEDHTFTSAIIACVFAFFVGNAISAFTPGAREVVAQGEIPFVYATVLIGQFIVGLVLAFANNKLFSPNQVISGALIGGVLTGFVSLISLTFAATPSVLEVVVVIIIVMLSAGFHYRVFNNQSTSEVLVEDKFVFVTGAVFVYYNILYAVPAYFNFALKKVAKYAR